MPVVEKNLPNYAITSRGDPGTHFINIMAIGTKIDAYREAERYLRFRPLETIYYYQSGERHYVWIEEKQRCDDEKTGKPERLAQKTF